MPKFNFQNLTQNDIDDINDVCTDVVEIMQVSNPFLNEEAPVLTAITEINSLQRQLNDLTQLTINNLINHKIFDIDVMENPDPYEEHTPEELLDFKYSEIERLNFELKKALAFQQALVDNLMLSDEFLADNFLKKSVKPKIGTVVSIEMDLDPDFIKVDDDLNLDF